MQPSCNRTIKRRPQDTKCAAVSITRFEVPPYLKLVSVVVLSFPRHAFRLPGAHSPTWPSLCQQDVALGLCVGMWSCLACGAPDDATPVTLAVLGAQVDVTAETGQTVAQLKQQTEYISQAVKNMTGEAMRVYCIARGGVVALLYNTRIWALVFCVGSTAVPSRISVLPPSSSARGLAMVDPVKRRTPARS